MKKTLLTLLLICLLTLDIKAQNIRGRIIDTEKNPIEFATVVLQSPDSVYIHSVYSDSLGYFSFNQKLTEYRLLIQHLMYNPISQIFSTPDVGDILMEGNDINLNEVVIKGERPLVKVIDGKMTYNIPQLLENKMANNAYEAILELPGVSEQSDAIQLAGSKSVTIILNGKPTTMSTEQLTTLLKNTPKERLQSAEIMYSAPPQYHVRGAAINLVLKDNLSEIPQIQGQVNTEYSQSHYASYKGGATLIYSTPTFSTDLMYQFSYNKKRSDFDLTSLHILNNVLHTIEQNNRGYSSVPIHNIRLGNDLKLNENNKLNLVYTGQVIASSHSLRRSLGTISDSENKKTLSNPTQMYNMALNYISGFGLTSGVDYTFYKNHSLQDYTDNMVGSEEKFLSKSKQNINKLSFYVDQSHKLPNNWTLNYGTKFSYASDQSSQKYTSLLGSDLSNADTDSNLDEYTYDLYVGFSKKITEKFSLTSSITAEYYKHNDKDYWSIYPAFNLSYVISPKHTVQYSLSSDKTYPSYWEMINAVSHLNGYTEIQGNPDLKPYNSYEMQLTYILKNKYIFRLYADYEKDYATQLPYQSTNRLALIYKTINLDYSSQWGITAIVPLSIRNVMNSMFTLSAFYDKTKATHFHDLSFTKSLFTYVAMLNNTFNISNSPNIKAELSGVFTPKNAQGPSTLSRMYKIDAGVKWISNDNNVELKLKVNDIFNAWSPKSMKTIYDKQNIETNFIPDNRNVSLSFTYKFGGYKEKKREAVDTSRFGNQ